MRAPVIDTHIHLDDEQFDADRDDVIAQARAANVVGMVVPAVRAAKWPDIIQLANTCADVHATLGLHPLYTAHHHAKDLQLLARLLDQHRVLAVGEIGLDYHCSNSDVDQQKHYFIEQLDIAAQYQLPVIIHAHRAVEDVMQLLRSHGPGKGVIHSYNGSLQQAHKLVDLGYHLGFGGPITYPRAKKIRKLVSSLPMQNLLLETDAPFQPMHNQTGRRNTPAHIQRVLSAFATIKNADVAEIAKYANRNARDLFALPPLK